MTSTRRRQALTRAELLDAALHIVDEKGLAALTMRRLGDAVGVEAMSLYNHVRNKEALLDLTVERMRSEVRLPDPPPDDWADLMTALFAEYRRVLTAHPNMLPLAARRPAGLRLGGLQLLIDHGLPLDDAVELYQSLAAITVGYSMLGSIGGSPAGDAATDFARTAEWRDETLSRALRTLIEGYRSNSRGRTEE